MFGFEDPIGKEIYTLAFNNDQGVDPNTMIPYTIVGVVKSFQSDKARMDFLIALF